MSTFYPCIFTNMYSLINPKIEPANWPVSLTLPPLDLEQPVESFFPSVPPHPHAHKESKKSAVTACPHTDKKHYAKQMCINCYHKFGRTKLAWKCSHKSRLHYAKGKCHLCYLHQLSHKKVVGVTRKKSRGDSFSIV